MNSERLYLDRLVRVLDERAIPTQRLVAVTEAVGAAKVYLAIGTFSDRVQMIVPASAVASAWREVLAAMTSGSVRNRTRDLTRDGGSITLSCAERSGDAEATFQRELGGLAAQLGTPADWRAVYAEAGAGADLGVTTECTAQGISSRIALRFGPTRWDRAIDLANAFGDAERARDAAVRMGTLAGQFEIDNVLGVETVHDPRHPDLVVWLKLRES